MTTTVFLVRHAAHGLLDRVLVGRTPLVGLSRDGHRQAAALASRLATEELTAVHASPRERAQETAHPIATAARASLTVSSGLDEIDMGEWTGRNFDDLAGDPRWKTWNHQRADARTPMGESMREVQHRVVDLIERWSRQQPEQRIAAVSHGDVIKAALLHYLGLSLDAYDRIEVSPASVSTLVVGSWGAKILSINERVPT